MAAVWSLARSTLMSCLITQMQNVNQARFTPIYFSLDIVQQPVMYGKCVGVALASVYINI